MSSLWNWFYSTCGSTTWHSSLRLQVRIILVKVSSLSSVYILTQDSLCYLEYLLSIKYQQLTLAVRLCEYLQVTCIQNAATYAGWATVRILTSYRYTVTGILLQVTRIQNAATYAGCETCVRVYLISSSNSKSLHAVWFGFAGAGG